ncbi:hypothetical protein B7463_g5601, partial [Scytalidium lignicola]
MASPPYSHSYSAISSPYASNTALPQAPKRRQSDMPFSGPTVKRRKASLVSTTSSNHPLRQTSFPPENASQALYSRSPSVETMSLVSGSGAGSQQKKKRGRKSKSGVNGNDDTASVSAFGGPALTAGSGTSGGRGRQRRPSKTESIDDEDEGGEGMTVEVTAGTLEEKQKEIEHRAMLVNAFDPEQFSRYEAWRSSKLSDAIVRRIVNQTLSQSAPASVILAVKSVAKMFAGEMIEGARKVQSEWLNREEPEDGNPKEEETRRGPLLPDHLREAIRRYKMGKEGCLAGQLSLWQHQQSSGVERFAVKVMGKRLFK